MRKTQTTEPENKAVTPDAASVRPRATEMETAPAAEQEQAQTRADIREQSATETAQQSASENNFAPVAEMDVADARRLYKENGGKIVDESVGSFISLRNIDKVYQNNVQAVFDFNLEVNKHDFVALVGPSGCGKSTTLRMIAGLEEITAGKLYIDGVLSNYLPSKDRDIAMVFQNYALYPQLNVYDNIAFGLKIRKTDKKEIEKRVFEAADILDLGPYLDRKPKQLSGGQMQRVALGRAIVRKAKLFLMDEPLSNLDAKLRVQMRSEIVRIHEEVGATTIYVTHDQTEAMTMANKIVVMNKGFVQQAGSPLEIYRNPATLFVATFIGTPPMNVLDCEYDNGVVTLADGLTVTLPKEYKRAHDEFMSERKREVAELIARADEASLAELKNYVLPLGAYKGEQDKKAAAVEKPRKVGFLERIKNKFVKKKKTPTESKEDYIVKLKDMLQKYEAALGGKHPMKLGVRPENIVITEKSGKDTVKVNSDIVEILGSEFIVYARGAIGSIVIKSQTAIEPHKPLDVKLDLAHIHLFDEVSERNILYNAGARDNGTSPDDKQSGK